jgi:formylmethanofuran dehydrogenase subunit B
MAQSSISGRVVPLHVAIAEAAQLIRNSRLTVIAGLGADVAGARAAIGLADQVGGAVDHMHASALLRDLDVMREFGIMLTTPGEARLRGDVVLLVGDGLQKAGLSDVWPDLRTRVLAPPAPEARRRIVWLRAHDMASPESHDLGGGPGVEVETIAVEPRALPALIAALRARFNGRPVTLSGPRLRELDAVAATLRSAMFGVAVWSANALEALAIEMLCGLVKDANAKTRFTGLPLSPADNAAGVLQTCGWMTGFPMRTGFGRGFPEHDPWQFNAERLVESGEADCALWISAYGAAAPRWRKSIPLIALADAGADFIVEPAVRIAVGRPGVDHDSVQHCARMGTFASVPAAHASETPSVAQIIGLLADALGDHAGLTSC